MQLRDGADADETVPPLEYRQAKELLVAREVPLGAFSLHPHRKRHASDVDEALEVGHARTAVGDPALAPVAITLALGAGIFTEMENPSAPEVAADLAQNLSFLSL